jgi:formylglycine-generating enzyme required for sulfatase activity
VWIAFLGILAFGAVVFLGLIVGVIILVANSNSTDSTTAAPSPIVSKRKSTDKDGPSKPNREPSNSEFVELFNGKDLTGWETYPAQADNWRVEKGVLIGSGPTVSHLFTVREDYKDFHLRVEARVNDGGDSGVYFRAKAGPVFPEGYEAQINSTHRDVHKTGSLYAGLGDAVVSVRKSAVPPGVWFTLEVIAEGNHFVVKINGQTTADYTDENRLFATGHIALQKTLQTVAEFRKIEIKELPAPKQPGQRPFSPSSLPKTQSVDLGGGVKMEFVLIPKGKFTMGSPPTEKGRNPFEKDFDAEKLHEVEITKPFYMAKYPVTQEQYEAITGENPSWFQAGKMGADKVKGLSTKQFPVETVSWDNAQAFCKKLREQDKQMRVFRLPTEAEWEYACRAGTTTPFYFGSKLNGKDANCQGDSPYGTDERGPYNRRTTKVGEYGENKWGLCDMHGNVCQWCEDCYGPYNADLNSTDPLRKTKYSEDSRVLRGGSWRDGASICRAACRARVWPYARGSNAGFRVVFHID